MNLIMLSSEAVCSLLCFFNVVMSLQFKSFFVVVHPPFLAPLFVVSQREHQLQLRYVCEIVFVFIDYSNQVMISTLTECIFLLWNIHFILIVVVVQALTFLFGLVCRLFQTLLIFLFELLKNFHVALNESLVSFICVKAILIFDNCIYFNSPQISKSTFSMMQVISFVF